MGIIKSLPDSQLPIQVNTPSTISVPSKSIFTSLVPESKIVSLLKYIEGYPWTVDFYGQILNVNNTLKHFDPSTPNLTQSYYKISKLILQISTPLSSSYDQSTGITTITGTAIVPYGITPNVGDVFIAQVDSGEDAIFIINTVSRKTHRKNTLYEINYSLYSYTSVNPNFITTLTSRVNETYFFNNDLLTSSNKVLIQPSVKEAIDRLKAFLYSSQDYYFNTFAKKQTGSILIPGIDYTIYDPLLLNFISKIVDYSTLVNTPFYKYTYFSNYIDQPSIFDALINQSITQLSVINRTYNFTSSSSLKNKTRFGTIFHAGIDYILYPINPNTKTTIGEEESTPSFISTIKTSKNYSTSSSMIIQTTNNNTIFNKPLLHDLFVDNYYVVSKNFYNYHSNNSLYSAISYIELLIYRFISKEAIAKEDLVLVTERYHNFSLLHQLYLLPVIWLIVKANI